LLLVAAAAGFVWPLLVEKEGAMRRILIIIAGMVALVGLSAVPASANVPDADQYGYTQISLGNTWVNPSNGVLYTTDSHSPTRFYLDYSELNQAGTNKCVFYDQSHSDLDLKPCNNGVNSDQWDFGGNNYSEWSSQYNGECVWAAGFNLPVYLGACSGDNGYDRWHWRN
jgi:hypothetical protein